MGCSLGISHKRKWRVGGVAKLADTDVCSILAHMGIYQVSLCCPAVVCSDMCSDTSFDMCSDMCSVF
jgi:hypothetical protein